MRVMLRGAVTFWVAAFAAPAQEPALTLPDRAPVGLPDPIPAPESNPLEAGKFALGQKLFFDPILSSDRTVSCASCHEPDHGFASRETRPAGVGDRRALRDAPTLLNRAWGVTQRWDGRGSSLEEQVLMPIQDPNEMALPLSEAIARLADSADHRTAFDEVFGRAPDQEGLSQALATFVRGLTIGDSPIDRFHAGDSTALSPSERAGLWIFDSKGRCWQCHSGPNFSDEDFHNTGIAAASDSGDEGRFAVTRSPQDLGKFKTPTLRAVALTAPFMHDGSLATLEDVVDFYDRGGHPNDHLDPKMRPIGLTDEEKAHLVAFLRALSR